MAPSFHATSFAPASDAPCNRGRFSTCVYAAAAHDPNGVRRCIPNSASTMSDGKITSDIQRGARRRSASETRNAAPCDRANGVANASAKTAGSGAVTSVSVART